MDIEKYTAGKDKGLSGVELQGVSTLLIKWPDGFDPNTGAPNPPKEQGFQLADLQAMQMAAYEELAKAEERVAMFDALMTDANAHVPQITANLAAAAKAAK